MPKKNQNKSKTKSHDSDMEFLDKLIEENKLLMEQQTEKIGLSPLEQSLNNAKKEETKKKIRNAIYMKRQMRCMPSKREIETQKDLLNQMMKHPKMTNEILQLYGKAIEYNPAKTLPTPLEIFDNDEQYRIQYYQYVLGIVDSLKEKNETDIKILNKILDNPYGHYMSKCLGCSLNPLDKKTNSLPNVQITNQPKSENETKDYDDISDAEYSDSESDTDEILKSSDDRNINNLSEPVNV
jgi:hypothetical protein